MKDLFDLEVSDRELQTEAHAKSPVITPKRRAILNALRTHETLSLDLAVDLIGADVYANKRFHVGNVLSAMVRAGLLRRLKPGLYALPVRP